jgi:hypothetical protein
MTKKDFELIARALKEARMHWVIGEASDADSFRKGIEAAATELANSLRSTNPRFDAARFLAACGVQ